MEVLLIILGIVVLIIATILVLSQTLFSYKKRSSEVARYYDEWNERYLDVYGDVIQAFRPEDEKALLDYTINSADLKDDQTVLDAGCGYCGPAVYFAQNLNLCIEGLTISNAQFEEASKRIDAAKVDGKVKVKIGDYHELDQLYPEAHFDRVLFLESLGHAARPDKAIASAYKVLKPEGSVYIKDFYYKEPANNKERSAVNKVIRSMNKNYTYNTLDLTDTITALRRCGFEIVFIKVPEFSNDITVRKAFEDNFGIDHYEGNEEFTPAEWLEIRCRKPGSWADVPTK